MISASSFSFTPAVDFPIFAHSLSITSLYLFFNFSPKNREEYNLKVKSSVF